MTSMWRWCGATAACLPGPLGRSAINRKANCSSRKSWSKNTSSPPGYIGLSGARPINHGWRRKRRTIAFSYLRGIQGKERGSNWKKEESKAPPMIRTKKKSQRHQLTNFFRSRKSRRFVQSCHMSRVQCKLESMEFEAKENVVRVANLCAASIRSRNRGLPFSDVRCDQI